MFLSYAMSSWFDVTSVDWSDIAGSAEASFFFVIGIGASIYWLTKGNGKNILIGLLIAFIPFHAALFPHGYENGKIKTFILGGRFGGSGYYMINIRSFLLTFPAVILLLILWRICLHLRAKRSALPKSQ
jgi:hypothetical protein